jgi:multidrug efflux pump subunit AcrA (membrane-fusion protein)
MLQNVLIFLVAGWVVYLIVIRRIRWRAVRFMLYVPILSVVAVLIRIGEGVTAVQQASASEGQNVQVVDSQVVTRGDLEVVVTGAGAIQPIRQVPLLFGTIGQVAAVNYGVGERVNAGDIIASLDTGDFESILANARIALEVQRSAFNALTSPAREIDIQAAQAALDAAQAQYYAAVATGPTQQQEEIARLQFELAKNQNYQLQLQRDAIEIPDPSDFSINLEVIPQIDGSTLPPEAQDAVSAVNSSIQAFNSQLNAGINSATQQQLQGQIQQAEGQRSQLNQALQGTETNILIAEQQYQSTLGRGPDSGAIAAANASVIQAQIALNRLLNGPSEMDVVQADLGVRLAENALAQAEAALADTELRAPFDGVIAQQNLTPGELPPQGAAVLLVDDSSFVVDLPIDETDVVKVAVGQRVELDVDALPDQRLTGVVTRIAYTPVRVGQLVTYTVRVALDETDAPAKLAMSVTARIITQRREGVVLVRNRFVRVDPVTREATVIVQTTTGAFEQRRVTLGQRSDVESEVLEGLLPGDVVVLLPRGTEGVGGFFN